MTRFMTTVFYLTLTLLLVPLPVFSQDIPGLDTVVSAMSTEQRVQLVDEGEVTLFSISDFTPRLMPDGSLGEQLTGILNEAELTLGIEAVFLYREIDMEYFKQNPDEMMLKLFNIFNRISTLEGLEYYSASRGEMRLLFAESYVINNLQDKLPQPDLISRDLPEYNAFFIHQKDMTFGNSESKITQRTEQGAISLSFINQTPLWYGPIRVISPKRMHIHLLVIPVEEGLLFYGVCGAKTLQVKAFENKASKSFYNRIKALYRWFTDSAATL